MPYIWGMANHPAKDRDKFLVRLPDGMRDRLAVAAALNKQSMTAEIVARLEASFAQEDPSAKGLGGVFARAAKNSQLNLVHRVDELQLKQLGQMAAQEDMRTQFSELADRVSKLEQKK